MAQSDTPVARGAQDSNPLPPGAIGVETVVITGYPHGVTIGPVGVSAGLSGAVLKWAILWYGYDLIDAVVAAKLGVPLALTDEPGSRAWRDELSEGEEQETANE